MAGIEAVQPLFAVAGFRHVLVSELVQHVDDDAAHRARVVDDQKAHVDILSRESCTHSRPA
jgi:hypothetical protein